jgi:chromate transporter
VHRIGGHALHDRWLFGIATVAFVGSVLGVNFAITLVLAGVAYVLVRRSLHLLAVALGVVFLVGVGLYVLSGTSVVADTTQTTQTATPGTMSVPALLISGLRAGLLTFGGAYTAIPFLQNDAVVVGGWMTNQQFLDGIALSGILPAPLIIFSTFVGYFGGGPLGAIAMTLGVFFPAFAFTLVGHEYLERLISNPAIHTFLDGVTAGVVGLIAAVTIDLLRAGVTSLPAALIFGVAL